MIRSDGIASDLLVDEGTQIVTHFPDCSVVRTPDQPDYWYGNCLIERTVPASAADVIAKFHEYVSGAEHICIQWDIENFDLGKMRDEFEALGIEVDQTEFLALRGDIARRERPSEFEFRPFGPDDWEKCIDLQVAVDVKMADRDPVKHRPYLEHRALARQAQIAKGRGQWFGAFDGDVLVGDLGIFCDDRVARYQSVQTRETHRKRGICSALMVMAHDWAKAQSPDARVLIAADADDTPRFLYRQLGFQPFETTTAVTKGSY